MKVNVLNEGAKYGAICGLLAIVIMYGSWAMGLNTFVSVSFWGNFLPYMIAIILIGGFQLRKQNGGFLPFAEALKFSFFSYVVAAILIAVATYVLYNLIDKELTQKSMQVALEKTRAMMVRFGANEEEMAKQLKKTEEGAKDTGIGKIFLGTGIGLIWDFIKALLITLIIRKEEKFTD